MDTYPSRFEFKIKPPDWVDTLTFNIATPHFVTASDYEGFEEGELDDGREYAEIEFELTSDLYYNGISCVFVPMFPVDSFEQYDWVLMEYEDGEWIESDIELETEGDYFDQKFTFTYPSIQEGERIALKIYGERGEVEKFNYAPLLYAGISAIATAIFTLIVFRKPAVSKIKTFKKRNWLYYAIAIGLTIGIGLGVYFGTAAMGLLYYTY